MSSSRPAPKLPLWIYFVADALFVATAIMIAVQRPRPWSETTVISIVVSLLAGTALGLVPLIVRYEKQKNETLDDRQRALEALARTVSSSAEQIGIVTSGLHEITELAQKNMKQADQLPHKLQEKIAEFQAQLANAEDAERAELEKELEELRASESDRLQSVSETIAKTAAELTKLESNSQQHLTAANDALGKLSLGTANAIGKAQAAAEQALSQARQEAARAVGEATGQAINEITAAKSAALAELGAQLSANLERLRDATAQLSATVETLQTAAKAVPVAPPPVVVPSPVTPSASPVPEPISEAPAVEPAKLAPTAEGPATPAEGITPSALPQTPSTPAEHPTPRRSRKARREEPAPSDSVPTPLPTPVAEPTVSEPVAEASAIAAEVAPSSSVTETTTDSALVSSEPKLAAEPEMAAPKSEPEFQAPAPAAEPVVSATEALPEATPTSATVAAPSEPSFDSEPAPESKPARKRTSRKADEEPGLSLDLGDVSGGEPDGSPAGIVEQVLTSDGATRLVVTAYIGIGNRLFIRGEGPGLSWEKGQALQFISIGKWRWETSDATAPIRFKLLKNDDQECTALGQLTVEPGHQHEVTATF